MAGEEVVWHVAVDGAQRGPLTKSEVLELLRSGKLTGSDLVWGPGFSDWIAVGETSEFSQPPRTAPTLRVDPRPQPSAPLAEDPDRADEPSVGTRWSLWRSASIGLLVSALSSWFRLAMDAALSLPTTPIRAVPGRSARCSVRSRRTADFCFGRLGAKSAAEREIERKRRAGRADIRGAAGTTTIRN